MVPSTGLNYVDTYGSRIAIRRSVVGFKGKAYLDQYNQC